MGASGLGALLVKEGFLTEQDRVTITKTCGQGSWAFAKCILSTGLLDEDELSAFFAERTKYVVAPKNLLDRLDLGIVEQVDRRMVSRLEVLPLEIDHHRITVAVADPLDKSTLKQLEFFTGLEVVPVIAPLSQIHEGLSRLNPEFKPRPTALSNFLRNHAGAAWIKQKIVEEGDVDMPQDRQSASGGLDYDDDQVEEVSLDDEIDSMDDTADNLNDIDASGLDEGAGNSDFDDIDLEDSDSDLELAPGEDSGSIDDAGLDVDDPFDNFDDAPKKGKSVAAPGDDDLEGLEAGGDIGDELWPDDDDAPAKPAPKAKAKAAPPSDDMPDDFGLDDEPSKPAPKAAASDLWPDDEEAPAPPPKKKSAALSADLGDDFNLDDESSADDAAADLSAGDDESASAMDDDLLGDTPDLDLDAEEKPKKAKADAGGFDDLDLGSESADLDEAPKPSAKKPAKKIADDDLDLDANHDALDSADGGLNLDDELGLGLDADETSKDDLAADDGFGLDAENSGKKTRSDDDNDDIGLGLDAEDSDDFGLEAGDKGKKKRSSEDNEDLGLDLDADDNDDFGLDADGKSDKKPSTDDNDDPGLELDADDSGKDVLAAGDNDDFGLDADDQGKKAPSVDDNDDLGFELDADDTGKDALAGDDSDEFGLDADDKGKKKRPADDNDPGLELDADVKGKNKRSIDDSDEPGLDLDADDAAQDDLGLELDGEMQNEINDLAAGSSLDDDLDLGAKDAPKLDDDLDFGSDELSDNLEEPAPKAKPKAPQAKTKAPAESTRMAQKPVLLPTQEEDPEDLVGIEFAEDEETSASLRKAVHEEGSEPEFRDPNFDDEPEETRIDLHAAIDDDPEFAEDKIEDTNIRLHPAEDKPKGKKEATPLVKDPLEGLSMGFNDDEAIDEPGIDDLALDGDLDDIPIEAPVAKSRAGGRTAPAMENGSVASLTATAKANEALLRMSLCFDRATALEIAREYLPQISGTGCLVNIGKTTETLATWRSGAQSAAQGKAAVYQRLAKAAKPNQWSEIPVSAQDDFGSVKAISVYKVQKDDGRVLLLAGDYPKDDDSLREALTSLAEQLGAK